MSGLELKQRVETIRQKVEERGLGEVLGRVSPGEVASVGADKRRVVIDVDFDTYLRAEGEDRRIPGGGHHPGVCHVGEGCGGEEAACGPHSPHPDSLRPGGGPRGAENPRPDSAGAPNRVPHRRSWITATRLPSTRRWTPSALCLGRRRSS
jgi:hypothetical protein